MPAAALAKTPLLPENSIMTERASDFIVEKMQIREAEESDADALASLVAELGYSTENAEARQRLIGIKRAGDSVLVAVVNSKVVGMIVLLRTRFLHRPPDGRIATLVVFEAYRGHGIGARLVRKAEEIFCHWGCGRVEVTSGIERDDAHRFYNREGYIERRKRFVKVMTLIAS